MTSPILDAGDLDIVQSEGYEGSAYIILSPQTPIFAARINGVPASTDIVTQVSFDTVTVGAYTDVLEGYTVLFCRTNDVRKPYWRGRARKAPTSTILYTDEDSPAVTDNDFIFVLNLVEVQQKKRYKTFFDYDLSFFKLRPIVKGIDSAYVKLTTSATAQFSFTPTGQALAKSATITSYLWSIPGATYNVGSASTQNITITVNTPYNNHGRLTITDSNGVTNWMTFTLTAGDPNADDFFSLCHEPIPIAADWTNGYSTSVLFRDGFDDVLDGTRVTVVVDERFNDGVLSDISPVRFVGYLKATSSITRGDATHGQIKEVSVEMASFLQIAGEINFSPIAIRHDTTPTLFDEISYPTPARDISYVLSHSTLLNVCAMDFGTIDDTYFSGNTDAPDTSMMDAVKRVASDINAYVTQGAAGMLSFERDPRLMGSTARNAVPVAIPSPITTADVKSLKLEYIFDQPVGSVEVGYVVFRTDTNTRYYLTSNAPASGPSDGQEFKQISNQLLAANSSLANAYIEAGERTGNLYALANSQRVIDVVFGPGWGFINPSPGEWYNFEIDAADDPRGVGVAATERWLCLSKIMTINANGSQDISVRFTEETSGGSSMISVSYVPAVTAAQLPVLPLRAVMGAFPPLASINYDTVSPTNTLRRDPSSGWAGSPLTPQEAAEAATNQPRPNTRTVVTSFAISANVAAGFTSTNGATYVIENTGWAQISSGGWTHTIDFTVSNGGFASYTQPAGVWTSGVGWEDTFHQYIGPTNAYRGMALAYTFAGAATLTSASMTFTRTSGLQTTVDYTSSIASSSGNLVGTFSPALAPSPVSWAGNVSSTNISLTLMAGTRGGLGDPGGTATLTSMTIKGIGTNPFTGVPGGTDVFSDAFYQYEKDADGNAINVGILGASAGAFINNATATAAPPPYNDNHSYSYTKTGDGNIFQLKYQDPVSYADNQNVLLYWNITGVGAGS